MNIRSTITAVTLAATGVIAPVAAAPAAVATTPATAVTASTASTTRSHYTVKVNRTHLTAKPMQHARFTIRMDHPGSTVKLQHKSRRGWVTLWSRTLRVSEGTGTLPAEVWASARGTHLFRVVAVSARAQGTSPVITLRVR